MKSQFTPAPWAHEQISEGFRIAADLNFTVAIVDCGTVDKMEANAKLIAASPELYSKLSNLIDVLNEQLTDDALENESIIEALNDAELILKSAIG